MTSGLADRLAHDRALPLLSPTTVDDAVRARSATATRGLGLFEVALRTPVALAALAAAVQAAGADGDGVLVGAGTVVRPEQVDAAAEAGAGFVVTPGWSEPVVRRCQELGLPVLPGIATPGEAMAALALGVATVKVFPAAVLGGPAFLRALAGPFPDLLTVPSGGVTAASAPDYLAVPTVVAVSGAFLLQDQPGAVA